VDVTIVWGEDWEGLYIDGELKAQGHLISAKDVLDALGLELDEIEADGDWLGERGDLPQKLEEVKRG
jgi:hypothetical protein